MNCTYVNLGLVVAFSVWLGLNSWPVYKVFAARCLFSVVFLHKAKQDRWLCAVVSTQKSLPHLRTVHRFTMKAPNILRSGQSLISSPRHGFLLEKYLESSRFWAIWRALRYHDDYVLQGQQQHLTYDHLIGWFLIPLTNNQGTIWG